VDDLGELEPPDDEFFRYASETLTVTLSGHARRQLGELGRAAEEVVAYLERISYDEITWSAESLPPQHGREMWMLWAGAVRVLFDTEPGELTVHGFGLQPHR
jgi:hypothetical protein